jgi:hypothetical protein
VKRIPLELKIGRVAAIVAAAVLLSSVFVLSTPQNPAGATFPGQNGKIAFVSYLSTETSGGEYSIFAIDPDDPVDDKTTLVAEEAAVPVFSPDGE